MNHEQILEVHGLHVQVSLGVFEHEVHETQPVRIDIDLNLGEQPLERDESNLQDMVSYLVVRDKVVSTCQEGHVILLETLAGKLAQALIQMAGIVGVRLRIQKLSAFLDAEIAVRSSVGRW
ncbi:MAG: dihydroneopterin aldolase [Brachymonas sp.]